jgi:phosphoribosyl 1,2-cyclic phosphodiesterase
VLIDCGVSMKAIRQALEAIGARPETLSAVFITHEHSDHIRGLPVLASKIGVPVYANGWTIRGILSESERLTQSRLALLETGGTVDLGEMAVTSFATSHDSLESVGYVIHTYDGHRLSVVTDLGFVSDTVMSALSSCELVMLESNHDVGMLQNGRYPYFLKKRILSDRGHLSNDGCAEVLPSLVECGARHLVLAHLSRDNNLPELAVETSRCALQLAGARENVDYTLEAAPRMGPGRLYEL